MKFLIKIVCISIVFFLQSVQLSAQIKAPIKWKDTILVNSNGKAEILITAALDNGWHIYSQHLDKDNGPVSTKLQFAVDSNFMLIGNTSETPAKELYDDSYQMKLRYIYDKAVFTQKLQLKTNQPFLLKASITFMVCNNTDCLPPETVEFEMPVNGFVQANKAPNNNLQNEPKGIADNPYSNIPATSWGIFIAGFLGGLLALLTPCVFPIIPLTVSFFTKQSKSQRKGIQNALLYSAFIIGIYVGIGLLVTLTLGPDALNVLASNVWVNLIFFIVFVTFAFSFLGAFEINLPSSWVNKVDGKSSSGSIVGIFFMALTLSLVSFSCTGPIVGSLLVQAAVGGNIINPLIGMLGFATALALPFGLFAAFPGWLNSLPKSGGWLNSVKVVLGLLELALSLKFISNVDLAYHWGIITREVFLSLWIIIFSWIGLYLIGAIHFSHDSNGKGYIPLPRFAFATLVFAFVVYLIPGLFGAPLKLISGFPPPQFYSEGFNVGAKNTTPINHIEGTHPETSPHGLPTFHDYDLGLAYAKKVNKPIMLDFTGWSCVNCRKMEDKVWVNEKVLNTIKNDYVLISLYVDDKDELPLNAQYISATTGKKIKTIGNKWSDFQTTKFQTNSQPFYVLMGTDEKPLNKPVGYEPDVEAYHQFLLEGLMKWGK